MSFNNLTSPVARKEHRCVHCWTPIVVGERHKKYAGIWEGDFQDWRVHTDCLPALDTCKDSDGGLCEEKHKRGLTCRAGRKGA